MTVFTAACVQVNAGDDLDVNLAAAAAGIAEAAGKGADFIALPENVALMAADSAAAARDATGEETHAAVRALGDAARKAARWVLAGTVAVRNGDKLANRLVLFAPDGSVRARYDKIHLFGFQMGEEQYHEARTIEPGNTPVTVDTPFGRLGLSICYDLRFPELYRAMKDVDIILVPSAFTETTGRAHWETLLRARAIENLAYVLAPAQGGRHPNGRDTHGDSMIIDPWGAVLDRLPHGPGVVMADVNLERMRGLRRNLPALNHRTM